MARLISTGRSQSIADQVASHIHTLDSLTMHHKLGASDIVSGNLPPIGATASTVRNFSCTEYHRIWFDGILYKKKMAHRLTTASNEGSNFLN